MCIGELQETWLKCHQRRLMRSLGGDVGAQGIEVNGAGSYLEEREEILRKKCEDLGVKVQDKEVEAGEEGGWLRDGLDEEKVEKMEKGGLV
jgi:hypothetical protein